MQPPLTHTLAPRRLDSLEERLYSGPAAQRNVSDAVAGLRALADAVPAAAAPADPAAVEKAAPDVAAGAWRSG